MGTLWVNIPVLLIFVLGAVIPAVFSALAHDKFFAFLDRYPLLGPVWLVGTFIGGLDVVVVQRSKMADMGS